MNAVIGSLLFNFWHLDEIWFFFYSFFFDTIILVMSLTDRMDDVELVGDIPSSWGHCSPLRWVTIITHTKRSLGSCGQAWVSNKFSAGKLVTNLVKEVFVLRTSMWKLVCYLVDYIKMSHRLVVNFLHKYKDVLNKCQTWKQQIWMMQKKTCGILILLVLSKLFPENMKKQKRSICFFSSFLGCEFGDVIESTG